MKMSRVELFKIATALEALEASSDILFKLVTSAQHEAAADVATKVKADFTRVKESLANVTRELMTEPSEPVQPAVETVLQEAPKS